MKCLLVNAVLIIIQSVCRHCFGIPYIWLPSPKYPKLTRCTPFASNTFTSMLFQVVFVSQTDVVTQGKMLSTREAISISVPKDFIGRLVIYQNFRLQEEEQVLA